jgi:hypothetical protein
MEAMIYYKLYLLKSYNNRLSEFQLRKNLNIYFGVQVTESTLKIKKIGYLHHIGFYWSYILKSIRHKHMHIFEDKNNLCYWARKSWDLQYMKVKATNTLNILCKINFLSIISKWIMIE